MFIQEVAKKLKRTIHITILKYKNNNHKADIVQKQIQIYKYRCTHTR